MTKDVNDPCNEYHGLKDYLVCKLTEGCMDRNGEVNNVCMTVKVISKVLTIAKFVV